VPMLSLVDLDETMTELRPVSDGSGGSLSPADPVLDPFWDTVA
jgi:hypothetical protein